MEYEDFIPLMEGWNKGLLFEQAILRKHAHIVTAALGLKFAEFNKAWPDPLAPKEELVEYGGMMLTKKMAQKLHREKSQGRTRLSRKNG